MSLNNEQNLCAWEKEMDEKIKKLHEEIAKEKMEFEKMKFENRSRIWMQIIQKMEMPEIYNMPNEIKNVIAEFIAYKK